MFNGKAWCFIWRVFEEDIILYCTIMCRGCRGMLLICLAARFFVCLPALHWRLTDQLQKSIPHPFPNRTVKSFSALPPETTWCSLHERQVQRRFVYLCVWGTGAEKLVCEKGRAVSLLVCSAGLVFVYEMG